MIRPVNLLFLILMITIGAQLQAEAILEVKKKWGVSYISGGVNKEEIEFLNKIAPRFPVQLSFKAEGEEGLTNGVQVSVFDIKGELVFQNVATGPKMFLNLDNGRYTVQATYQTKELSYKKDLTGRRYLVLFFDFSQ